MKLLNFKYEDICKLGVKYEQDKILDVTKAAMFISTNSEWPRDVDEVISKGSEAVSSLQKLLNKVIEMGEEAADCWLEENDLKLGASVIDPNKIICVGLNYRKHAEETNSPIPEYPILFSKFNNTLAGHGEEIPLPVLSDKVDYEGELAIVIGKKAKNVTKEQSLDYVFGYCNANDLSARDLQMRTQQWLLGKTCDKFAPIGPYLVTADEVGNPNALEIRTIVNGEIRQHSTTSDMIFHCDEIVSYISKHMTLLPGDVILTGTPEGVVAGYPSEKQVYLQSGDKVTIEIEKLGSLTNSFVKATTNT